MTDKRPILFIAMTLIALIAFTSTLSAMAKTPGISPLMGHATPEMLAAYPDLF